MKIRVKSDGYNFTIPIPTGLIFSKPSVWLYLKLARKFTSHSKTYLPEDAGIVVDALPARLPDQAVYAFCAEIMRIKRKYRSWELVHVISSDGDEVHITL